MVAVGFFEFRLGREALAVTKEGAVAVCLQVLREFPKSEYLSFALIVAWRIAKRAFLGQQALELALKLLLPLLLQKLREAHLFALLFQPLDDDVGESIEALLLLRAEILLDCAWSFWRIQRNSFVQPHSAHVLHLVEVDLVMGGRRRSLIAALDGRMSLEVLHGEQFFGLWGFLALGLDDIIFFSCKEQSLVYYSLLVMCFLWFGEALVLSGIGDASFAGEGGTRLLHFLSRLEFASREGCLTLLHWFAKIIINSQNYFRAIHFTIPRRPLIFMSVRLLLPYNNIGMRSLIILVLLQLSLMLNYNSTLSQRFQRYTIITHCSNDQLMSWSCKACQILERPEGLAIHENKIASILAYTGYSRSLDRFMLVFRGTVDAVNWVEDFTFKQVDYPRCKNCKVHQGFYLSYLAISDDVSKALESLRNTYGEKRLHVLGASLGGAIAMIGGLQLELKYQSVEEIHTFGCPRVGNEDYSMYLKSRVPSIIRVIHNRDIVPHVPLQTQNFHHPPFQIQYDEQMSSFKICSESGEDPSCSNSFYPYFTATDHVSYWTKLNVHDICS